MSNAVGSREVIPKVLRARKNLVLKLTQEEFNVLIGSILGDGYITKLGRIQISKQQKYLEWKYQMLRGIVSTSILQAKRERSPGMITTSYRFWTKQYFRPWRNIFYPCGKKIIPKGIRGLFSPLVLAVWYMDDGFLRKKNAIGIATDRFSENGLLEIQKSLIKQYGIESSIVYRGRIYLGKEATRRFVKVVQPFIIPSMQYKLP